MIPAARSLFPNALSNAETTPAYLECEAIDAGEVREAVQDIVADGRRASEIIRQIRAMIQKLREREVLPVVVRGLLNKQVGHRLGVTEKTVKFYRGNVMQKMNAGSLADLVRMAEKSGICGPTK